jgi:CubicO group peptidase (beta-lactamase class C family)
MPIMMPPKRKMPQSVKRHIALRDLAHMQAGDAGEKLSRSKADARARELAKDTLPHTADFWKTKIEPGYE